MKLMKHAAISNWFSLLIRQHSCSFKTFPSIPKISKRFFLLNCFFSWSILHSRGLQLMHCCTCYTHNKDFLTKQPIFTWSSNSGFGSMQHSWLCLRILRCWRALLAQGRVSETLLQSYIKAFMRLQPKGYSESFVRLCVYWRLCININVFGEIELM